MRSQTVYPVTVNSKIFETIKIFWKKGIFDDYSEKHFIIHAINNDVTYFKELFLRKNIKDINPNKIILSVSKNAPLTERIILLLC